MATKELDEKERARGDNPGKAVIAARVEVVLDLIIQGASLSAAWRFVTGKTTDGHGVTKAPPGGPWDISPRTFERYAKRAKELLAKEAAPTRAQGIATARRRYELILSRALAAGDLSVAERANRSIARLDGLEAPTLHAVAGTVHHDHAGTVEHAHTHRAATLEERAEGVRKLFDLAAERKRRTATATALPPGSAEAAG